MTERVDAIVVGAGIAGLAVGAELARDRSVVVLEQEPAYASHSTARSAASWIAGYGRPAVRPFSVASRAWYDGGGGGRLDRSLLEQRGLLIASTEPSSPTVDEALAGGARRLDAESLRGIFPALRAELHPAMAYEPEVYDVDVMAAVEAHRSRLLEAGGRLRTRAGLTAIVREGTSWRIEATEGTLRTGLVVDAAGAWADEVAVMAGVAPLGLRVLRRTACTFEAPPGADVMRWPLVMSAQERWYLKPDAGVVLGSAADEVPQPPGDARPPMEEVALALDRIREATTLDPRGIRSSWAGLRTFAPDRSLVLGPDPTAAGFAWYAGLGGFGIQTAPAAARSVVGLLDRGELPADVVAAGGSAADVLPDRLR